MRGVVLFLTLTSLAGADELKADAQLMFEKGQRYYQEKNWSAALAMFEAARNLSPNSSGPYAWIGLTNQQAGDCAKAVPFFEEYLRRQPKTPKPEAVKGLEECRARLTASKPAKPTPPPPTPEASLDAVDQMVVATARESAPVLKRVGDFFKGAGKYNTKGSEMFDQYVVLDAGKCYVVAAAGGPGVTSLYLYLWDPANKRLDSSRNTGPTKRLELCPKTSGKFRYQVKFAKGEGSFSAGVFAK